MRSRYVVVSAAIVVVTSALASLPAAAAGPRRVLEVNQPPVARIVDASRVATLNQAPNQSNGIFSDASCALCGTGAQAVAENFVVATGGLGFSLSQIVVWGGYYSSNTPLVADDFDVYVYADASGLPAASPLCSELDVVPSARATTGVVLFGVDEYVTTIDLAAPCALSDGTYWVSVVNNTGASADDWFWEVGNVDLTNGVMDSAFSTTSPGSAWQAQGEVDMAVQLNGSLLPVELQSFSAE